MYLWTAVRLRQLLEKSLLELDREYKLLDVLGPPGERVKQVLVDGAPAPDVQAAVDQLPTAALPSVKREIEASFGQFDQRAKSDVLSRIEDRIADTS
jgi:hypothetical protein